MDEEELWSGRCPTRVEAEQAVLGSMLIDARCVPEVIEAPAGGLLSAAEPGDL